MIGEVQAPATAPVECGIQARGIRITGTVLRMSGRLNKFARSEFFWLLCIVSLGAALRTYFWFHGFALEGKPGLVRHGDGYLDIAATFRPGSHIGFFDHWRASYQFIYPLYLAPLYAFELNDSIYIFWLHHAFAAATTCLIYLVSRRLFGSTAALLSASIDAGQPQFAYWFNWALADMAFHFHLALFFLCAAVWWNNRTRMALLGLIAAAFLMCFTRPEGFLVSAVFSAGVLGSLLSRRLGFLWVVTALGTLAAVVVVAVGILLVQNEPFRERVLSNTAVGWGLYYGSQRTPTQAAAVDELLLEMRRYGSEKAAVDPQHRNPWYWNSLAGIERIKKNPISYLGFTAERIVNAYVPSFFGGARSGGGRYASAYIAFERTLALFVLIGTIITLRNAGTTGAASLMRTLFMAACFIYVFIGFYQSEWDVRVQLSPQVLLIPIAAYGWVLLFSRVAELRNASKSSWPNEPRNV